ncbi:hypothetical protein F5B22DRAFT_598844 [Xylaria bambusicola]|uniref:uncharacterized protein n=1 Tax=Xylaria bambusicola TaxID=326684 RepID=UPI0020081FCA|nr:uncharacterized protein F5B22DRAFT_598844 [Xylaria bambusicola]KAI0520928.1 hypothetical protein F5B22DRAFT_598844 [Xylaria bambusicola]
MVFCCVCVYVFCVCVHLGDSERGEGGFVWCRCVTPFSLLLLGILRRLRLAVCLSSAVCLCERHGWVVLREI